MRRGTKNENKNEKGRAYTNNEANKIKRMPSNSIHLLAKPALEVSEDNLADDHGAALSPKPADNSGRHCALRC